MKVLDRLFIKGFIGPCLLAFFVVEFVLIMQKLWQQIDKILGKGYGILDYLELIYYFALGIIPMALPLTVLLSSVMVYGDMAEKYELSSLKSSGISFTRMLFPGILVSFGIAAFSVLASNYLKPQANEGFQSKIRHMRTNKLTFAFDEKIFNRDFKNFSIRVGKKLEDGKSLEDVMIYDHSDPDDSVVNMIRAAKGKMYTTPDVKYLVMDLEDGYQIKEVRGESADKLRSRYNDFARPMIKFDFSNLRKTFDLAEVLDLSMVNVSYRAYEMMNTNQLIEVIDSLNLKVDGIRNDNVHDFSLFADEREKFTPNEAAASYTNKNAPPAMSKSQLARKNSKSPKKVVSPSKIASKQEYVMAQFFPDKWSEETKSIVELAQFREPETIFESVRKNTNSLRANNGNSRQESRLISNTRKKYVFELHQMYAYATICILFLFIGAPAGAIVRKGGFGYPVLIAIGFYLTFVMSNIFGKKMMLSGALTPEVGAWLPCFLLVPFAFYLSWRALHDNRALIKPMINKLVQRSGSVRMDN